MKYLLSSCIMVLLLCGCQWLSDNPDSLPEEIIEGVIEKETGVDIDFTPASKEVSMPIPHHWAPRTYEF